MNELLTSLICATRCKLIGFSFLIFSLYGAHAYSVENLMFKWLSPQHYDLESDEGTFREFYNKVSQISDGVVYGVLGPDGRKLVHYNERVDLYRDAIRAIAYGTEEETMSVVDKAIALGLEVEGVSAVILDRASEVTDILKMKSTLTAQNLIELSANDIIQIHSFNEQVGRLNRGMNILGTTLSVITLPKDGYDLYNLVAFSTISTAVEAEFARLIFED